MSQISYGAASICGWHHVSIGGHIYLLEVVSLGSVSPLLGISGKATLTESWEPFTSQNSGTFYSIPSDPQKLHISFQFLVLWASFLPCIPDLTPLPLASYPLRSLPFFAS